MGGIARANQSTALAIGGMEDHVHILISLPTSIDIASSMRTIKSGSSRFMHEACKLSKFEWQEGYGAFSIGHAQIEATVSYIQHQQQHHQSRDFQAELLAILHKHDIAFFQDDFLDA